MHLLKRWTALSGELPRNSCTDLKEIMVIEFSEGKISCWSSVKAVAEVKDLRGWPSQYGQRTEEETEVRRGGQGPSHLFRPLAGWPQAWNKMGLNLSLL